MGDGAMSAGEKSIKQALEAVEEKGSKMEGKIFLTRQILVPPAVQNHQDFGPNAACTSILLPLSSTASSRSVRTFHQQTLPRQAPDSPCHSRPPLAKKPNSPLLVFKNKQKMGCPD